MSEQTPFPFPAVVGAEDAKLALLLATVDPAIGGVLLRGDKGSAKTTLARGLAELGKRPFVDLPLGATEERVVGSLDLAAALTGEGVRVQPGLLAAADGGVLYVDEVNLLADHLVDVLLDVATSGVNRIERDAVSHTHAARFVLVGSMNPEEGDLRPQLLDRFGLAVDVRAAADPDDRAEAVARRLTHDADPHGFAAAWGAAVDDLRARLAAATPAPLTREVLVAASRVCVAAGAEGLRADLVLARAAAALAGWEGRHAVEPDDVRRVAPLVLAHRARRDPLDPPGSPPPDLDDAVDRAFDPPAGGDATDQGPASADQDSGSRLPADQAGEPPPADQAGVHPTADQAGERPTSAQAGHDDREQRTGERDGERTVDADAVARVVRLATPRTEHPGSVGRRSPATGERGRTVGARPFSGSGSGIAPVATVTAAATRWATNTAAATGRSDAEAPNGAAHNAVPGGADAPARPAADRTAAPPGGERRLLAADLREPVRDARTGNLLVLAVDASGSMGVDERIGAVKGALLGLLVDAYQRRDRVALVTFGGRGAEVVLRPTGSVEVARTRLDALPTGGDTPLAAGIRTAADLAARATTPWLRPLLVLVTDGHATAGPDPVGEATAAAGEVARRRLPAVVVDVEAAGSGHLGLAAHIASAMGARHLPLGDLRADRLEAALRTHLRSEHTP